MSQIARNALEAVLVTAPAFPDDQVEGAGTGDEASRKVLADRSTRYVVITLTDAKIISNVLRASPDYSRSEAVSTLAKRLQHESGADMADIARQLQGLELCPACAIEAQESSCSALDANRLGRRLRRLLERARGWCPDASRREAKGDGTPE